MLHPIPLAVAIPLGPVYVVGYVMAAASVYFVLALSFGLPFPGLEREDADTPRPRRRGRRAPKPPASKRPGRP